MSFCGMFAYNSAFMLPPFLNSSLVGMLTTKRCMTQVSDLEFKPFEHTL